MTNEGPKYQPYATWRELAGGIVVGLLFIGAAIAFVTFA